MGNRALWGVAGSLAFVLLGVAVWMAWSFLTPVGDLDQLTSDGLRFSVDMPEADAYGVQPRVRVHHHVEANWEYVQIEVSNPASSDVDLYLVEGSARGEADWFCASGLQAASGGSPEPFEALVPGEKLVLPIGPAFSAADALKAEGVSFGRANMVTSGNGVTCQRTGATFERRSQGLVLLAGAKVTSSFSQNVSATLEQSLQLPVGWEVIGRAQTVSTRETFGHSPSSDPDTRYSFVSSPERAVQSETADQLEGLQLVRDSVAESDEATRAWVSALIAGVAVAMIIASGEHILSKRDDEEAMERTSAAGAPSAKPAAPRRAGIIAGIAMGFAIGVGLSALGRIRR